MTTRPAERYRTRLINTLRNRAGFYANYRRAYPYKRKSILWYLLNFLFNPTKPIYYQEGRKYGIYHPLQLSQAVKPFQRVKISRR